VLLAGDLDAAEKALAAGKPAEALEALGDLADRADSDPRAWVVQGRALLLVGDPEAAVEPLVRASEKRPEDKDLARDAANACWRSASGVYGRLYLEDAKRLATRAGDDALLAEIAFAMEDYEGALARYRKLALGPGAQAPMRVADCLKLLGRADEAREAYAVALEACLKEEDLAAAFRAAFAAGRGGRLLLWLDERIAAKPEDLGARLYRGYVRAASSMYPEAIEDLRFCVGKVPGAGVKDQLSFALLQHGVRMLDKAMVEEAAALAREVLDATGTDVEAAQRNAWERLVWIAGYRWQNGDLEGVYAVMKDLHGREPSEPSVALNFGMAARRLGRYDEARATYEGMLEISPDDAAALNDYGILLDGLGDREAARSLWGNVLAEEPGNLDALENLFTDAWERGDTASARDYARRGLAAAQEAKGPVDRWVWFEDRLLWAPRGFGG
jgi:tetratricopeptide (TPR) repeat protein